MAEINFAEVGSTTGSTRHWRRNDLRILIRWPTAIYSSTSDFGISRFVRLARAARPEAFWIGMVYLLRAVALIWVVFVMASHRAKGT